MSNLAFLSWVMVDTVFSDFSLARSTFAFEHAKLTLHITITSIIVFPQTMGSFIFFEKALGLTGVILLFAFIVLQRDASLPLTEPLTTLSHKGAFLMNFARPS